MTEGWRDFRGDGDIWDVDSPLLIEGQGSVWRAWYTDPDTARVVILERATRAEAVSALLSVVRTWTEGATKARLLEIGGWIGATLDAGALKVIVLAAVELRLTQIDAAHGEVTP